MSRRLPERRGIFCRAFFRLCRQQGKVVSEILIRVKKIIFFTRSSTKGQYFFMEISVTLWKWRMFPCDNLTGREVSPGSRERGRQLQVGYDRVNTLSGRPLGREGAAHRAALFSFFLCPACVFSRPLPWAALFLPLVHEAGFCGGMLCSRP